LHPFGLSRERHEQAPKLCGFQPPLSFNQAFLASNNACSAVDLLRILDMSLDLTKKIQQSHMQVVHPSPFPSGLGQHRRPNCRSCCGLLPLASPRWISIHPVVPWGQTVWGIWGSERRQRPQKRTVSDAVLRPCSLSAPRSYCLAGQGNAECQPTPFVPVSPSWRSLRRLQD